MERMVVSNAIKNKLCMNASRSIGIGILASTHYPAIHPSSRRTWLPERKKNCLLHVIVAGRTKFIHNMKSNK